MISIIELFMDVISMLIVTIIAIWVILLIAKAYCQKNKRRKDLKAIINMEKKLKGVGKFLLLGLIMFIKMVLCTLLAIGIKPLIFKLNYPLLGEGYATFASYMIAICLYLLLPDFIKHNE